ncbi:MAG TPA: methenyltetrahydrofolate cyclohydrolase [Sphingobacteriaceae bacterium]|nr:methenyltetrahydrofolate cyclohydrolase [Sphingobacteriaceae bacterium]
MSEDLLELTTRKLLEKFGAGNHKPGSGSAAAFQGMISAQLLITVIELTNGLKHRHIYSKDLPVLLKMQQEISDRIYPELEKLFLEDSVQFGKTIESRSKRDRQRDLATKQKLALSALDELKVSIDIPSVIADLCIELSDIGAFVFSNGFKAARGDSQVALSGAVSAVTGCLSIVRLNLLSFGSTEYNYIERINVKCHALNDELERLNRIVDESIELLALLVDSKTAFYQQLDQLVKGVKSKSIITNADIEEFASGFQNLVWVNKESVWKLNMPTQPSDILNPSDILQKVLGYGYDDTKELEQAYVDGRLIDTAGIIDQENKMVWISSHITPQVENFTAAHELAHALLHDQPVMHRDIPLDGSKKSKAPVEYQADQFAAAFLMPRKRVTNAFENLFGSGIFQIDANTTFKLTGSTVTDLHKECKDIHGLCSRLAEAESYDGEFFTSLADQFNVSRAAMAYRLEELGLVKF